MRWALAIAVMFGVIGCERHADPPKRASRWSEEPVERMGQLFGGTKAAAIVASPDRIIVSRLDVPKMGVLRNVGYLAWPDRGRPVELDVATRTRLASIVAADDTYRWTMHSMCIVRPGVKLRFMKAGDELDLYLCFECLTMLVRTGDGHIASPVFDGRRVAELIKPLFPDDVAFQELKVRELPRD